MSYHQALADVITDAICKAGSGHASRAQDAVAEAVAEAVEAIEEIVRAEAAPPRRTGWVGPNGDSSTYAPVKKPVINDLTQRITATRDSIARTLLRINDGDHRDLLKMALETMSASVNGLADRDEVIRDLLQHSLSHYGRVADDTSGIGAAQAAARHLIGDAQ